MEKEEVLSKFWQMTRLSWSFERLTENEQDRLRDVIFSVQTENAVKGNYKQRWAILNSIYHSFLMALDYAPTGWREEEKDLPLF